MGNRMSSLPVAQYCGLAPRLSDKHGAGRAAAISTAAHARAAGDPKAEELRLMLTEEERADLDKRVDPEVLAWEGDTGDGVHMHGLEYVFAEKELEVMLDASGCYTDDPEKAISVGHLDMAWVYEGIAFVVDIKASRFTTPDGPESLQLHAYGIAYADKTGCDRYVPGLFYSDDGQHSWGAMVDVLSDRGDEIRSRVLAAATRDDGEPCTGPHCRGCWGRLHCPEHTLKGVNIEALVQLTTGDITPDGAAQALEWLDAAKDITKKVEETLKAYADRNNGIRCADGKVWTRTSCKGRMGVNIKRLREDYPDVYEQVYERGSAYSRFARVKA